MWVNPRSATRFLREVRHELKGVQWPGRSMTIRFTSVIVIVTVVVAAVTALLDFALSTIVERVFLVT